MTLELYHSAHSTCSQKVRLCLAEKGLDWIPHELHFASRDHLQYRQIGAQVRSGGQGQHQLAFVIEAAVDLRDDAAQAGVDVAGHALAVQPLAVGGGAQHHRRQWNDRGEKHPEKDVGPKPHTTSPRVDGASTLPEHPRGDRHRQPGTASV